MDTISLSGSPNCLTNFFQYVAGESFFTGGEPVLS